jgi:hypothetical protein
MLSIVVEPVPRTASSATPLSEDLVTVQDTS